MTPAIFLKALNMNNASVVFTFMFFIAVCLTGCNKTEEVSKEVSIQGNQTLKTQDSLRTAKNDSITEKKDALFDNVKVIKADSQKTAASEKKNARDEAAIEANDKIRSQLKSVFSDYLSIKEQLYDNDSAAAQTKAKGLLTTLINSQSQIGEQNINKKWRLTTDKIKKITEQIDGAISLASQRTLFNSLSEAMMLAIQEYGLDGKTIYQIQCSSALNGKGGMWLTDSKDSDNPYYGKDNPKTEARSCISIAGAWEFD